MAANGDDLAGVEAMLKWLAFVPPTLPGTLPVLNTTDPIHRDIEYTPNKGKHSHTEVHASAFNDCCVRPECSMLKWLALMPPTLPGILPVLNSTDPQPATSKPLSTKVGCALLVYICQIQDCCSILMRS